MQHYLSNNCIIDWQLSNSSEPMNVQGSYLTKITTPLATSDRP